MSSPSNGALYLAPATLPVKANASASGGATVTQVEFFANGISIGVDTASPYQFDWTGVAAGSYSITAVVTDSNGATATSAARNITVAGSNTPPTVSLSAPADNSRYLNPPSVTLSATASGPELNDIVQSVAFYLNGNLVQTVTSAPFTYAASGLAVGTYTLTAVATDSQGAQTTSAARTFTVSDINTPPTVSLVIPTDNSNWNAPATVTYQASVNSGEANDTVSVEFFANGVSQGVRSGSPFSLTTSLAAGTYTISAVATDGQGAQTTSTARTINVSDTNLPPAISITSPTANSTFPNPPVASIGINTNATGGEVNGWVTKVEFYANGTLIGTRIFGPWNFTWTNVTQGNYSLTAIAYDNFNATTTSAPVSVRVGNPPTLAFIEVDHLNSPRAIYDSNQQLRWKWDQGEPFGVNAPDENPSGQGAFDFPVRFPGQYFDKETNLAYNSHRDYDAAIGRYDKSDPIGLNGGLNSYLYGGASPLIFTDPQGLALVNPGEYDDVGGGGGGGFTGVGGGGSGAGVLALLGLAGIWNAISNSSSNAGGNTCKTCQSLAGPSSTPPVDPCDLSPNDPACQGQPSSGSGPNWDPKSRPTWGHTFARHGQGSTVTRNLTGRAGGTGVPQGQWLNNQQAANYLQQYAGGTTPQVVRIPAGLGQVVLPGGQTVPTTYAQIIFRANGLFRSCYPILPPR